MKEYTVKVYTDLTIWHLNGKLHREDGPAVEWSNGGREWYLNGKRHREDGPAVEWSNGTKSWYLNGQRHREDGPAFERADGHKEWWVNGERLTEQEFKARTSTLELTLDEIANKFNIPVEQLKIKK